MNESVTKEWTGSSGDTLRALELVVQGDVQGVGFRPFVHRLARELELDGWIRNSPQGVEIRVEGCSDSLQSFQTRLRSDPPPPAAVTACSARDVPRQGLEEFVIQPSQTEGRLQARILPDLATCPECLREIRDPGNRRYGYPFTNCTHCGPRFSIVQKLPYDRPNTTMGRFEMCPTCRAEYEDPMDRRFHAQPNACPECGPRLRWWNREGEPVFERGRALRECVKDLEKGGVVAVKGLGGFHLVVDATSDSSVRELRRRKGRPHKPLALMYPDLTSLRRDCRVSPPEREILTSRFSPIVLLERRVNGSTVAASVAPDNPYLGVMLPYTPLHHLLMRQFGRPVVATSANRSGEPICTDEDGNFERLKPLADGFLVHDRPIARPVDDSVVQVVRGKPVMIRSARGFAPQSVATESARDILAAGGQLKNTLALASNGQIRVSQHLGDLGSVATDRLFRDTVSSLEEIYRVEPEAIGTDPHPDYTSTRYARSRPLPNIDVQHHHAHVVAAMVEHRLRGPCLGVAWDGTGWGPDRTIWGGEFLRATRRDYTRVAHLRPFLLPGGERAVREPRRSALGILHAIRGENVFRSSDWIRSTGFEPAERGVLKRMLETGLNSPTTTSMGRLFDAVSSILGLHQVASFEGQAACDLQFLAETSSDRGIYPFELRPTRGEGTQYVIDWEPMIRSILRERDRGEEPGRIAARFHNTLVEIILSLARQSGQTDVVLTGGCFQNRRLLEDSIKELEEHGFTPFWPQRFPANDGGLSLGQAGVVAARMERGER